MYSVRLRSVSTSRAFRRTIVHNGIVTIQEILRSTGEPLGSKPVVFDVMLFVLATPRYKKQTVRIIENKTIILCSVLFRHKHAKNRQPAVGIQKHLLAVNRSHLPPSIAYNNVITE
jgi:hypothetical protein